MTTIMQPFQCDLQPQIQETTHTDTTTHCRTEEEHIRDRNGPSRTRRTHEVPFIAGCNHFTRGKNKVSCSCFLPKTQPRQQSCSHDKVTTSQSHHFPPLPFVTTSLSHHFPSSPLPLVTTSLSHHFPKSPLPIGTTSLPHHFPSSPLPFVTISLRHHFPSSPLPLVTTGLPHHTSHRHHFP